MPKEPTPTVEPEDVPTEEPAEDADVQATEPEANKQDVNAKDDKGQQLFFPRKHVEDLRKENAGFRQRNKELEGELTQFKEAQEAARIKELQDKQEYETLYKESERKHEELLQKIKREEVKSLRLQIGMDMGLPMELSKRLDGVTEEEIRLDAERVVQLWITPEEEQPASPRPTTTSAVPGGEPPSRNREDKRAEFFSAKHKSPMFQGDSEVQFNVKDKRQFGG